MATSRHMGFKRERRGERRELWSAAAWYRYGSSRSEQEYGFGRGKIAALVQMFRPAQTPLALRAIY